MRHPESSSSFEVRINRFDHSEGVVALNGLSQVQEVVNSFDEELTHQGIWHERDYDENGDIIYKLRFNVMGSFEPRYDWPTVAYTLGRAALKLDIDPTILIRDPGKVTDRLATDIPVLHDKSIQ